MSKSRHVQTWHVVVVFILFIVGMATLPFSMARLFKSLDQARQRIEDNEDGWKIYTSTVYHHDGETMRYWEEEQEEWVEMAPETIRPTAEGYFRRRIPLFQPRRWEPIEPSWLEERGIPLFADTD